MWLMRISMLLQVQRRCYQAQTYIACTPLVFTSVSSINLPEKRMAAAIAPNLYGTAGAMNSGLH